MFALNAVSRALLAAAAFAAFGAAFVTTPIVARGEAGIAADPPRLAASGPERSAPIEIVPRRDPFEGGGRPDAGTGATSPRAQVPTPAIPPFPQIPAALRPLPPNAGAGDAAFGFATGARTATSVTALITGPQPFALVDDGGTTRIVTVGDRVDGRTIVSIGVDGLRLSGGTTLPYRRPPS